MKKQDIPGFLYRLGVRQYASGTVKQGRKKVYDYVKCDPLTDTQKADIVACIPKVRFGTVNSQYAPELKATAILIPAGKV